MNPYSEKEYTGIVLALKPKREIADWLAIDGFEKPEDLHVTLAYLGEASNMTEDESLVLRGCAQGLSRVAAPIMGTISGVTRFSGSNGKDAIVLNVDSPQLPEFRQAIVETLERLGFSVARDHGFSPHITLAYVGSDEEAEIGSPPHTEPVVFDELYLMVGGEHTGYPMIGSGLKAGFFFTDEEGRTRFAGGPGGGGGSGSGGTQKMSEDQIIKKIDPIAENILSLYDQLQEVNYFNPTDEDFAALENNKRIYGEIDSGKGEIADIIYNQAIVRGMNEITANSVSGKIRSAQPYQFEDILDRIHNVGIFEEKSFGDKKNNTGSVAKAIADRANKKGVDEQVIISEFIEPWLQSVFGTPKSNQLQKIASRTFGFSDPPGTEELKINWKLLYPMGEMYNITQEHLQKKGFVETETIPVYHPYVPTEATPKQWSKGDEVRIKLLPLTSWTTDIKEAVQFAEFLGSRGQPAFVLKTFIPVKSIVSTPETGIGVPGTGELVLAGGEYEALVEAKFE